jgi:hypothetical protein
METKGHVYLETLEFISWYRTCASDVRVKETPICTIYKALALLFGFGVTNPF